MAWVILREGSHEKWKGKEAEFEAELIAFAKTKLPGFACPEALSDSLQDRKDSETRLTPKGSQALELKR
ncbi:2879_t:CDS:2 [Acaulospora colombiana]|uniref:2879_t:CDS:1 n=1 Tax=Acaulospora colombiana TaxID=27376 RepID=A0ACA9MUA2_9GLOM|nr:2879_t:CDS:2 [Acaulospora colombiana]